MIRSLGIFSNACTNYSTMDTLVQVQVPFPTSTASLDSSTTSASTDHSINRTSTEGIASRWTAWFKQQPDLPVPPALPNASVDSFVSTSLSEEQIQAGKDKMLQWAFTPTTNEMLNVSQLRILYCFLDLLHTPKDAYALRLLLQDRLFCTISDARSICIQKAEFAGDFFRLLLLYFDPTLALNLDSAYKGWEDSVCTLVVDPVSYLEPEELWSLLESLQGYQQRSVLWVMLWLVHTVSLHSSSPLSASFDVLFFRVIDSSRICEKR